MIFVFHIITVEVEEKPPSAKKVKKEKKKKIKFEQPAEEEVKGLKNRNFTCGLVSFPDPITHARKGSGDIGAFSWSCAPSRDCTCSNTNLCK